jgi:hypothetical protein
LDLSHSGIYPHKLRADFKQHGLIDLTLIAQIDSALLQRRHASQHSIAISGHDLVCRAETA